MIWSDMPLYIKDYANNDLECYARSFLSLEACAQGWHVRSMLDRYWQNTDGAKVVVQTKKDRQLN